ncbi:N-acetyltransferase 10 [Cryomyces antarcticus]|nr:N-acetyltransferase 10 [Cryomyces antarcticus]
MLDYHVILDLLPTIANLFFTGRIKANVKLSGVQTSLLLAIGLQRKTLEDVEKELGVPSSQLLAMFIKVVRKVSTHFRGLVEGAVTQGMPDVVDTAADGDDDVETGVDAEAANDRGSAAEKQNTKHRFQPLAQNLDEELAEGGNEVKKAEKERMRAMIDALPLDRYEVPSTADWAPAERLIQSNTSTGTAKTVSVKSKPAHGKRKAGEAVEEALKEVNGSGGGGGGGGGTGGKKVKVGRNGR